ncbi:MAG: hypothetical protein ACRD3F_15490 [Acidobacteriaceae bacterium]
MHLVTPNSLRLSTEISPQVPQKAPCGRKTARVNLLPRIVSHLCAGLVLGAVLALCPAGVSAQAADQDSQQTSPHAATETGPWGSPDTALRKMTERMAKDRNTERQKKIVSDTAKLLAMAKKLNDEVSQSSKNELSIDVVKQAAQIEKLAKSIKEKMRNGY